MEGREKKSDCGNVIAEIGREKKKRIVAITLPKQKEREKNELQQWHCQNRRREEREKK